MKRKRPRTARERTRDMLRKASAGAADKYGAGGLEKTRHKPKPITLPKLKSLEESAE